MLKKLTLSTFVWLLFVIADTKAQSISPAEGDEVCPLTELTFTITITDPTYNATNPTVTPSTGAPQVTVSPSSPTSTTSGGVTTTTFTFKGKFLDQNINQAYDISYKINGVNQYRTFTFTKIKSLHHANNTCTKVTLSSSTIYNVARCDIENLSISFTKTKYGNNGSSSCFGEIDEYEYKLPAGYSIGSTVSTGSNWITGDNNVTVTTNSNTAGTIYIRPKSECGLSNNQTLTTIAVFRPEPSLAIPETDVVICTGYKEYTITGLPSGSTTTWSITNNDGVAYISNATNTSVRVNRSGSSNGYETLTATVTYCGYTSTRTKVITFGYSSAFLDIYNYNPLEEPSCYEVDAFYIFRPTVVSGVPPTGYQWSYRVNGTTTEYSAYPSSYDGIFLFSSPGTYDIIVRGMNECGLGSNPAYKTITVEFGCYGARFSLNTYPNPTNGILNVAIEKEANEVKMLSKSEKISYKLYELKSMKVVKEWTFSNTSNTQQLNVSGLKQGIHILIVTKGKYQQSKRIIIN